MKIELFSDVVCPWCCIGKRNLELALENEPVTIVYRAFELDPSQQVIEPTTEMLARKYRQSPAAVAQMMARVEHVAASVGLEYHLQKTLVGNTFDAHRLLKHAESEGLGERAWARVFRWYFTEARSLFDAIALRAFATDVGIPGADEVLASDRYADVVTADQRRAREIGVQGVPFFVFADRVAVEGAQPAEVLRAAFTRASQS